MSRLLSLVMLVSGCDVTVARTNPYDPEAPYELQRRGTVTGVVELEGGAGASGAHVSLVGRADLDADAAADGAFTIAEVPAGTYLVTVTHPDPLFVAATSAAPVTVGIGRAADAGTIVLKKRPAAPLVVAARRGSATSIELELVAPLDADVTGYRAYLRTPASAVFALAAEGTTTLVPLTGLSRGQQYYLRASALDADGLESDLSLDVAAYFIPPVRQGEVTAPDGADVSFSVQGASRVVTSADGGSVFVSEPAQKRIRRAHFATLEAPRDSDCAASPDCISLVDDNRLPGPMAVTPDGTLLVSTVDGSLADGAVLLINPATRLVLDSLSLGMDSQGPLAYLEALDVVVAGSFSEIQLAAMSLDGTARIDLAGGLDDTAMRTMAAVGDSVVYAREARPSLIVRTFGAPSGAAVPLVATTEVELPGLVQSLACGAARCVVSTSGGQLVFVETADWSIARVVDAGLAFTDLAIDPAGIAYATHDLSASLAVIDTNDLDVLRCSPACFIATAWGADRLAIAGTGDQLVVLAPTLDALADRSLVVFGY